MFYCFIHIFIYSCIALKINYHEPLNFKNKLILQDSYKHTTGNTLLSHQPKRGGGKMNGALLVDPDNVARPDFSQMVPFKPKVCRTE